MKTLSLGEYINGALDYDSAQLMVKVKAPLPRFVDNLKTLSRLELLTDEVVLSLLAQAPIDPLGVYGAMKHMGVWAFSPIDFTMIQVLAKKGDLAVALMRIDLMSDDMTFVALDKGHLVEVSVLEADFIAQKLKEPGATEAKILHLIQNQMKRAIDQGLQNAG